jgi:energy-coupling factor transporter transmembrane protein EcfT
MTSIPDPHTDHDSFLRRCDPRVKIGLFVLLIIFVYLAPTWHWMAAMTLVGVVIAVTSRTPWRWLLVLLALQIPNVLGLIVIPAIGQISSGSFQMIDELAFGLRLGLGWIAALLIGVSLLRTMDVDELTDGLIGIGLPKRFAFMVGYAFLLPYLSINDIVRITYATRLKGLRLSACANTPRVPPPSKRRGPARSCAGVARRRSPSCFWSRVSRSTRRAIATVPKTWRSRPSSSPQLRAIR